MRTPIRRLLGQTLLIVALMAPAACSSGSKNAASPSTRPATTNPGTCRAGGGASPGGSGGADVTVVPGDIPDTQAFVPYQSPDGYHVSVPEGWARSQAGGAMIFSDKFNSIRVQVVPAAVAPSPASAQSDTPALAGSVPCFQAGKVSQVSRKGGQAILITYRADSPADAVTGKVVHQDVERYEFWQAGKLAAVTLSSPQGSDNIDPWRKVTDSFAWGS